MNPKGTVLDPTSRLRIATRIHFALMRHFGEDVEISSLLKNKADTREVMWVCEASGDVELITLARQFQRASKLEAAAEAAARAPVQTSGRVAQDTGWSRDTSGIGLSRPLELEAPPADATHSWFSTPSWMRRSAARTTR